MYGIAKGRGGGFKNDSVEYNFRDNYDINETSDR